MHFGVPFEKIEKTLRIRNCQQKLSNKFARADLFVATYKSLQLSSWQHPVFLYISKFIFVRESISDWFKIGPDPGLEVFHYERTTEYISNLVEKKQSDQTKHSLFENCNEHRILLVCSVSSNVFIFVPA